MSLLNQPYQDLQAVAKKHRREYVNNSPYAHISFDNFFDPLFLKSVLAEFPDLEDVKRHISYNNPNELKLASVGAREFGPRTTELLNFVNSEPFLEFLQELTGIEEALIPDPYFEGAGYHQIKQGGFLKIHSDFNKHVKTGLDRRMNLLVYLNEDWKEEYGGHFELWDKKMQACVQKILPSFNTIALFTTTDFSYHGHPNPLTCPDGRSRKSLAIYYYSNGRPATEVDPARKDHPALFLPRKQVKGDGKMRRYNSVINFFMNDLMPPVIVRAWRKMVITIQKK
jgi:2OG-Fe(II) oxygenase superfamily